MIKRWNILPWDAQDLSIREDENGEWVRHKDHVAAMEQKRRSVLEDAWKRLREFEKSE